MDGLGRARLGYAGAMLGYAGAMLGSYWDSAGERRGSLGPAPAVKFGRCVPPKGPQTGFFTENEEILEMRERKVFRRKWDSAWGEESAAPVRLGSSDDVAEQKFGSHQKVRRQVPLSSPKQDAFKTGREIRTITSDAAERFFPSSPWERSRSLRRASSREMSSGYGGM